MKDLGPIQVLGMLAVSLCLAACTPKFQEVHLTDLPVVVSQPDAQQVDVDVVIESARQKVQEILPGAYLSFFSFAGKCEDLPELHGQIKLDFIQVQPALPRRRVRIAFASVDTIQRTMDIRTMDLSPYYWRTDPLILEGLKVEEVADILYQYLVDSGVYDCTSTVIEFYRVRTEDRWEVACPDRPFQTCLEIDRSSGRIWGIVR
jgi:hypothetical protein